MLHVIVSCGMRLQSTSEDNGHIVGFVKKGKDSCAIT